MLIHVIVFDLILSLPLFTFKMLLVFLFDLPFKASNLLCIAHNLAKVDVKHVSTVRQHDVVIVAVADSQDEGGHTPPCTRVDEVHHGLRIHSRRVLHSATKTCSKSEYSSVRSSIMIKSSNML